jgi:hypothetical protein
MVGEMILAEVPAEARRHTPSMNEVVQQIVDEIAVDEAGEDRVAHRSKHRPGGNEEHDGYWRGDDERHDPAA